MKQLLFILSIFIFKSIPAQLSQLKGTWITPTNQSMFIQDTGYNKTNNSLENNNKNKSFELFIYGDTLSFQEGYYSSATNYKKLYIDKYNFKLVKFNDSQLVVKPVSTFSKAFFNNKTELIFTRQKYLVNNTISLDKIIFHTTECYGTCPTYHLQIDNNRTVKLFAEQVFDSEKAFQKDSSKAGYFTGLLSSNSYDSLISILKTCNLKTLSFNGITCCDGSIITIIVYYNGQRKYLKSMIPPRIADNLISYLYSVCRKSTLTKSIERFTIEQ